MPDAQPITFESQGVTLVGVLDLPLAKKVGRVGPCLDYA